MNKLASAAILIVLSLSAQALTPNQRREIRNASWAAIYKCGAESMLSPEITKLTILSEQEHIVSAQVEAIEFGPFLYKVTFDYDLAARKLLKRSIRCSR